MYSFLYQRCLCESKGSSSESGNRLSCCIISIDRTLPVSNKCKKGACQLNIVTNLMMFIDFQGIYL